MIPRTTGTCCTRRERINVFARCWSLGGRTAEHPASGMTAAAAAWPGAAWLPRVAAVASQKKSRRLTRAQPCLPPDQLQPALQTAVATVSRPHDAQPQNAPNGRQSFIPWLRRLVRRTERGAALTDRIGAPLHGPRPEPHNNNHTTEVRNRERRGTADPVVDNTAVAVPEHLPHQVHIRHRATLRATTAQAEAQPEPMTMGRLKLRKADLVAKHRDGP